MLSYILKVNFENKLHIRKRHPTKNKEFYNHKPIKNKLAIHANQETLAQFNFLLKMSLCCTYRQNS